MDSSSSGAGSGSAGGFGPGVVCCKLGNCFGFGFCTAGTAIVNGAGSRASGIFTTSLGPIMA